MSEGYRSRWDAKQDRTKFVLNLPEDVYQTLVEISKRNGVTVNETIRAALEMFKVVEPNTPEPPR